MELITKKLWFPAVDTADEEGLLAVGGDLSPERLLLAYKNGIFPWYNEADPICWWSPDPRMVLFPQNLKVSKSMRKVLKDEIYTFSVNRSFKQVIEACGNTERKDQDGTWISTEMKDAYLKMHEMGFAHSAETWLNNELVGGLYGIRIGNIFFGESMFSTKDNASKFAFIKYVDFLEKEGVVLIDCQIYTNHLASLGAELINRDEFIKRLRIHTGK